MLQSKTKRSSTTDADAPAAKKTKGSGLSLAELREKHRRERLASSASAGASVVPPQTQPVKQITVSPAQLNEASKMKEEVKKVNLPMTTSPARITAPATTTTTTIRNTNPFSMSSSLGQPLAKQAKKNPFGVLASIESSTVSFPVANRLMTRYNSSPNVLQTSPWAKRAPLTKEPVGRLAPVMQEEEEDDEDDAGDDCMSDLECTPEDEDVHAFRMASAAAASAETTARPADPGPSRTNSVAESSNMEIETGAKPRLFSILVDKKAASFEKQTFTSCNDAFTMSRKVDASVNSNDQIPVTKADVKPADQVMEHQNTESSITNDFEFDPMDSAVEAPLLDYSLKTGMVLISSECQPWFKERTEAERYSTIHHHIQKTPLRSLPLKAQFDANLVSHVYPNGPKAPTHVGLMTRILAIKSGTALKPFEQSELAFFTAKEEEWRQSFKSVFASLEQGHSEYFYYMNSEFTVLFQSPEFAGNTTSDYRALLTKANSGLRGALISKKIKFKMIIAPAKVKSKYTPNEEINEAEVQETKKELKEMEHLQPGRTISKTDHHQAPLQLLFTGMESLKQLHDYLLTWVEQSVERRALHQPVLISPSPFLNASIKLADIVKIEQIESTDVEAIRTSSTKRLARQTAFKLKITGFLLPTAVANIKSLIESSSLTGDHIRILMDLEERTSLLNIEAGSVIEDIQKEGSGVEKVGVEKVELNSCGKTVKTLEYANRTWL